MGVIEFREVDWLGSRKVEPGPEAEAEGALGPVSDGRLDLELDPRLDDEPVV